MFRRIVVPLDGSELAEQALVFAEQMASEQGSELVLLRVVNGVDQTTQAAFVEAKSQPRYDGIVDTTDENLVSSDFIGNAHSAIIDLNLTKVVGGNLLKVIAWYDNEWGYSNRLVEQVINVGKTTVQ